MTSRRQRETSWDWESSGKIEILEDVEAFFDPAVEAVGCPTASC
jgi:hypothetical protein